MQAKLFQFDDALRSEIVSFFVVLAINTNIHPVNLIPGHVPR